MVTSSSSTGHVAVVEEIYNDEKMLISEYNWNVPLGFKTETISQLSTGQYRGSQPVLGYIYLICKTHTWDKGVITKEPTCKKDGLKRYTCTVCGETKDITIAKGEKYHKYKAIATVKATLTTNGQLGKECIICGKKSKSTIYRPKSFKVNTPVYKYNGKAHEPAVTITDSKGKTISSKYYTLLYKNNKNVGFATVTVKFSGRYSGSKKLSFEIRPAGTGISKLISSKKSITVKWKKQTAQTTGYQIQYATDSKYSKDKKTVSVKDNKTVSKKISDLKAGKKYYVRIRTYKTVNGINLFSSWSETKSVKTLSKVVYVKTKETRIDKDEYDSYTITYKYDKKGKLTEEVFKQPKKELTTKSSYIYNSKGKLSKKTLKQSDGTYTVTNFKYDGKGKLIKETAKYSDGTSDTTTLKYNDQGKLIKKTHKNLYGNTEKTTYKYNNKGKISKETLLFSNGEYWVTTYSYNSKNKLIEENLECYNNDGINTWSEYTTLKYDSKGRLAKEEAAVRNNLYTFTYKYDSHGNLIEEKFSDAFGDYYTSTFTYKAITI